MNIIIYIDDGVRARRISFAMIDGITRVGDKCDVRYAQKYNGEIEADVAIFYGLRDKLKMIFDTYKKAGKKAILIDLGYWERTIGGKLEGYHKIVINDYYPTKYFRRFNHDDTRAKKLNLTQRPFKQKGSHVLIAGMSGKSSWANDLQPNEYEKWALNNLKRITERPIMYRPKPSWKDGERLNGFDMYSEPTSMLEKALNNCWAVVTHHSNVSIDALLYGVPVFVTSDAPAVLLGKKDLTEIESPYYPSEIELTQWINDLSYTQWTPHEMESGDVWNYLKSSGLLEDAEV